MVKYLDKRQLRTEGVSFSSQSIIAGESRKSENEAALHITVERREKEMQAFSHLDFSTLIKYRVLNFQMVLYKLRLVLPTSIETL